MRIDILFFSITTASLYPVSTTANSDISTLYKQKNAIISNITSTQNDKYTSFLYCEEGPSLVIANPIQKKKVKLNNPCFLTVKDHDSIYTFHKNYIKQWRYKNSIITEHDTFKVTHPELIDAVQSKSPSSAFIDNHLNVYLFIQHNEKISTTVYNLTKPSLAQFFITSKEKHKLSIASATTTNEGLRFCATDKSLNYSCHLILPSHKTNIKLTLNKTAQPININNIHTFNKKTLWINHYRNNLHICSTQQADKLFCITDTHTMPRKIQKFKGIGQISQSDLFGHIGFYDSKGKYFSIHKTKVSINHLKKTIVRVIPNTEENNKASTLSAFKRRFSKKYKNLSLINFNNENFSVESANQKIDNTLIKSNIVIIEGKPEFINKLQPKSIPVWTGADLLLAVKEADNIYHIRTLNYDSQKLTTNPEHYFDQIAEDTDSTIKKLQESIKKNNN